MKISARNVLKARVTAVTPGAVNSEVTVRFEAPAEMVAIITKHSAEALGLRAGREVYAIIKASSVMLGAD